MTKRLKLAVELCELFFFSLNVEPHKMGLDGNSQLNKIYKLLVGGGMFSVCILDSKIICPFKVVDDAKINVKIY